MKFANLKDLIKQATKDGACESGIQWLKEQPDLDAVLSKCKSDYRAWALAQGYVDFLSDLSKLSGWYISWVLAEQPELIDRLDTSKMDGGNIGLVLEDHPQLIDRFDTSKMDGWDISHVIREQPQLIDRFDTSKMSGRNISYVLRYQPQLADKLN